MLPLNFFLIHAWFPIDTSYFSYNAVSWSISTELTFYLSFPFFMRNWSKTYWWKWPLAVGIVLSTIAVSSYLELGGYRPGEITSHGLVYINPLGRILEFVTGIAACSAYRWLAPRLPNSLLLFTIAEICGGVVILLDRARRGHRAPHAPRRY